VLFISLRPGLYSLPFSSPDSHVFRRPQGGIFLSYPRKDTLEHDFKTNLLDSKGNKRQIDLVVVSDGEAILVRHSHSRSVWFPKDEAEEICLHSGHRRSRSWRNWNLVSSLHRFEAALHRLDVESLQRFDATDLFSFDASCSTAKAVIYTLAAGVHPGRILSVVLDVGTNNKELLEDPLYVGWNHQRLKGKEYDDFVDSFVKICEKELGEGALLHFEDFGEFPSPGRRS